MPTTPAGVPTTVARILKPLEHFLRVETAGGVVLLASTICALVWANSPWQESYPRVWHAAIDLAGLELSAHFVINDVLMAIFFLVVGLEIRREVHDGVLAELRVASLPIAAAFGGIVAPALIYIAFNPLPPVRDGWAVPTATDIAFAVGVLSLLGKRVDPALRTLLLALAIADDIVAVLVIAFFFADGIAVNGLILAVIGSVGVLGLQKLQIQRALAYALAGVTIWVGFFHSGVHPVLAGVVLGLLAPMTVSRPHDKPAAVRAEIALHPWVAYGVMPLFALANAGVSLGGLALDAATPLSIATGIVLGLVLGKPLGIVLAVVVVVRMGICRLPAGVKWRGVALIGCLGGIGFTMSIFIASLAFPQPELLAAAKFAVLVSSLTAGLVGVTIGLLGPRR